MDGLVHGLAFGNGITAKTRRRKELRGVILSGAKDLRHPDKEPPLGNLRILRLSAQDDTSACGSG